MAEKLKPEIKSPGQAWMEYVDSKEGHNAAAVTPSYLTPKEQDKRPNIDKKVDDRKKELDKTAPAKDKEKEKPKEREKDN